MEVEESASFTQRFIESTGRLFPDCDRMTGHPEVGRSGAVRKSHHEFFNGINHVCGILSVIFFVDLRWHNTPATACLALSM